MERVVKRYSDRIQINGERPPRGADASTWLPRRYESAVARTLGRVFQSAVGGVIRRHLKKKLVITPHSPADTSSIASTIASNGRDAAPAGEPRRYGHDHPNTPYDETGLEMFSGLPGTGLGSNVHIWFTPGDLRPPPGPRDSFRHTADGVLAHELAHAVRMMWGVSSTRRFDPKREYVWGMENTEEYFGWVVAMTYASERRYPMRQSYSSLRRLRFTRRPNADDLRYRRLQQVWMKHFERDIPTFAAGMAAIPRAVAEFNPFAQVHEIPALRPFAMMYPRRRTVHPIGPPEKPSMIGFDDVFG